jgi:hypothetical protein
MRPQVRRLKSDAIEACNLRKFPFTKFMERGLENILIWGEETNASTKDLAVRLLVDCCVTNGKFNNFQVGLLTLFKYLGASQNEIQVMKDLLAILDSGGQETQIRRWLDSNF